MDLGRHLRELLGQRHFDVKRRGGDRKLQWHAMLLVHWSLAIEQRVRVLLAQLVDLDVSHGCRNVGILLLGVRMLLTRQHVIVRSALCTVHLFLSLLNLKLYKFIIAK